MQEIEIRKRRDDLIEHYGRWSGSIHLGDNLYTTDNPSVDTRLRRCLQITSDLAGKPFKELRVLDLACLECEFGIEFALHGAEVIGIEGREANLRKAEFVRDLLSLNNLQLIFSDVRNLSREQYGEFDVILCLGILYHMDTPDAMTLVEKIFDCCRQITIIDTHFSLKGNQSYSWKENLYWGHYFKEHDATASEEQRLANLWASIDNSQSFVLTRPSLYNLLHHVGFTSVYECFNPYVFSHPAHFLFPGDDRYRVWEDRTTFVAIKGRPQKVMSSPVAEEFPDINRPEKPTYIGARIVDGCGKPSPARKLLVSLPYRAQKALLSLYHAMPRGQR